MDLQPADVLEQPDASQVERAGGVEDELVLLFRVAFHVRAADDEPPVFLVKAQPIARIADTQMARRWRVTIILRR